MQNSSKRPGFYCLLLVLAIGLLLGSAGTSIADDAAATAKEASPPEPELTGREIYARYTEQRTKRSRQELRIISRDPGGSEQLSRFELRVQDDRDEAGRATRGVRFRTRIDVSDPFDMRHTKYLIIDKDPGPNDEYIYQPSSRRVRRVYLSETSFLGTDYTFGDFAVKNVDDATHVRMPDQEIGGEPVYVVESKAKDGVDAQYRKTLTFVEKQHFVPLRTRSWDEHDVEVKTMNASPTSVREFDGVWLASESTVRDLLKSTESVLFVDDLDSSPKFNRSTFSSDRLQRGK